jgi:hypothetical protein
MYYLICIYIILFNITLYYIFFNKSSYKPYLIDDNYIYQTDPYNKGEYSRFNYKTKECVSWIAKKICNEILFSCKKLKPKILVLGVALGEMIVHLSNKRPDFIITGIDISDINFNIVNQYSSKNITLIKEDANIFIKNSNDIYDYIICDIFDSVSMPDFVLSKEFLDKINIMLIQNGKFLLNSIGCKNIMNIFKKSFINIVMKTNNINVLMIVDK